MNVTVSYLGPFLLLLMVIFEMGILKYLKKQELPLKEINFNFSSGHILMWIFRAFEVAIFAFVSRHLNTGLIANLPLWAQWVFTFFAWDCCFYWLHRLHHKIPIMWSVHEVHHQGEHYSLSLGIRNSWYSSVTSIPFFLILAVLGVSIDIFVTISAFHYTVQFYNHNGVVNKSGILEYFMVTPAHHRIHHGANPEYVDKNFGGTFCIWDKLFGTFQKEVEGVQIRYGINEPIRVDNPFWANNIPVMQYLKLKLPSFELPETKKVSISDNTIALGGLLLWLLVVYYISIEHSNLGLQQYFLFGIVFLGTIALGAMSDSSFIGTVFWLIITLGLSAIYLASFSLPIVPVTLFALFFLHGLYVFKSLIKKDNLKLETV